MLKKRKNVCVFGGCRSNYHYYYYFFFYYCYCEIYRVTPTCVSLHSVNRSCFLLHVTYWGFGSFLFAAVVVVVAGEVGASYADLVAFAVITDHIVH